MVPPISWILSAVHRPGPPQTYGPRGSEVERNARFQQSGAAALDEFGRLSVGVPTTRQTPRCGSCC